MCVGGGGALRVTPPACARPCQASEFKDLVQEDHFAWVARYLVIKRVSSEQNFHSLYMSFLDTLDLYPLEEVILRETYRNIKVRAAHSVSLVLVWERV